jgi:hypothetical protein
MSYKISSSFQEELKLGKESICYKKEGKKTRKKNK